MPSFNDFLLQPSTRTVLDHMGVSEPTPIQAESIPVLLAGHDLVGQSATGSGKTLAYSLPLVQRISSNKRVVQALVLVPTRELAVQVNTVLGRLATSRRLSTALLVGGRPYGSQISSLRYGSQIVVGTPGRVKDHLDRGTLVLNNLRICILDEADQMLDSGFAPAIEEILATTPDTRQMALFSATMPDWVAKLEEKFLKDPVKVVIAPPVGEQITIEQIAYQVPSNQKMAALCTLLQSSAGESSLIFGRTKFGVERLGKQLSRLGFTVGTLHGNKSQHAREEVLTAFRRGQVQTLLATNVAARGLDIRGIAQVINYELPESSELFTHRIGRTGRMGHQGKAITLLTPSDIGKWRRMTNSLGQPVTLQRLTISEDAMVERPIVTPEPEVIQEREVNEEPRPMRSRRPAAPFQEREQNNEPRPIRNRRPAETPFQERELNEEPRPGRNRRPAAPFQERVRRARPERDSYNGRPEAGSNRRSSSKERVRQDAPVSTPEWQSEESFAPRRPASGSFRGGRRGAANASSFNRARSKRDLQPMITTESQPEPAKRKVRTRPTAPSHRAAVVKRATRR